MNVKTILAAKGGDIISIEPTATLSAAAKLLGTHRIGAVLILGAGGRLAGILSERDIVRAISEHDAQALSLPVGQVMTRSVTTCGEADSIADIMESMTAGKFRHMPVMTDGQAARRGNRARRRSDARLHTDGVVEIYLPPPLPS
jgi:CBS domain-containing protein